MAVAIPILVSAALGSVQGGLAYGTTGAILFGAIGAAVGALSLIKPKGSSGSRGGGKSEIEVSSSIRSLPVPVVFGKARLGGNYIQLGRFYSIKDNKDGTPGRRLQVMNAVLGLCEGEVRSVTNIYIDGKTIADAAKEEKLPERYYVRASLGPPDEEVARELIARGGQVTNVDPYPQSKHVAYQNVAKLLLSIIVGEKPRLADFNADVEGADLTIRRARLTHEETPEDVIREAFYDAYTESFHYTIRGSSEKSAPYGMGRTPRERSVRSYTPPPTACSGTVERAFYLGRNDILVMQDPGANNKFFIGHWGIAADSSEWETVILPEYEDEIKAHFLDELQGCVHTVHEGATGYFYILKWNLLTGRITRIDTDRAIETLAGYGFAFNSDLNGYIMAFQPNRIYLIDADSGRMYLRFKKVQLHNLRGFCVSGQRIGVISTDGVVFFDPNDVSVEERYGDSSTGIEQGAFGGISNAFQNTWTGQVCMAKESSGSAAYINFIPSVLINDDAKGTVLNPKDDWIRDWQVRQFNHYTLTALEGRSSVAAAMWATLVDEPSINSARWGAGLSKGNFSLPSFESVHSFCVGGMKYTNKKGREYYGERYRFDLLMDAERSASELIAGAMLVAINGYRTVIDGKFYVGVHRATLPICWHFTDHQLLDGKPELGFVGRTTGVNRVRVEFSNTEDDYRNDFAEANDEFDQDARGRVMTTTVQAQGVGRHGHADLLAKNLLDQVAVQRRQISFKTHFLGLVLTPGDGIEVSSTSLGLTRTKFKIISLTEEDDGTVKIEAIEHAYPNDPLKHITELPSEDGDNPIGCESLARSAEARIPMPMSVIHAAVLEMPTSQRLVPIAGVPYASIFIQYVNVYYSLTGGVHDFILLGPIVSSIGGFVADDVSATQDTIPFDGVHGTPDDANLTIDTPLPIIIGAPDQPGTQGGNQELALATGYDAFNQVLDVSRTNGQAWTATTKTIGYAYIVKGVEDECGKAITTYRQARAACGSPDLVDVWLPSTAISNFPFYVVSADTCYKFLSTDPVALTPGTILTDYEVVSELDSRCCPDETTGASCPGSGLPTTVTASGFETIPSGECGFPWDATSMWDGTLTYDGSIPIGLCHYSSATGDGTIAFNADNSKFHGATIVFGTDEEGNPAWILTISQICDVTGGYDIRWVGYKRAGSSPLGTYTAGTAYSPTPSTITVG